MNKRYELINYLIKKYGYKRYLEIGIDNPSNCYARIECQSKTSVDPFKGKSGCGHFRMTSNQFFEENICDFDIIFVDSSEPVGPSAALHRKDFYESAKTRLNADSAVVAQIGSPLYHLDFIKACSITFKKLFQFVRFYVGPAPSYPGGSWCYAFLSDSVDPLNLNRNPLSDLKYYNQEIHRAAFALPPFLKNGI